jgi:hypothetical protein
VLLTFTLSRSVLPVHRDAYFSMGPEGMQSPVNQDSFLAPILFQGNMGCNLRSSLGKLTGLT